MSVSAPGVGLHVADNIVALDFQEISPSSSISAGG